MRIAISAAAFDNAPVARVFSPKAAHSPKTCYNLPRRLHTHTHSQQRAVAAAIQHMCTTRKVRSAIGCKMRAHYTNAHRDGWRIRPLSSGALAMKHNLYRNDRRARANKEITKQPPVATRRSSAIAASTYLCGVRD